MSNEKKDKSEEVQIDLTKRDKRGRWQKGFDPGGWKVAFGQGRPPKRPFKDILDKEILDIWKKSKGPQYLYDGLNNPQTFLAFLSCITRNKGVRKAILEEALKHIKGINLDISTLNQRVQEQCGIYRENKKNFLD